MLLIVEHGGCVWYCAGDGQCGASRENLYSAVSGWLPSLSQLDCQVFLWQSWRLLHCWVLPRWRHGETTEGQARLSHPGRLHGKGSWEKKVFLCLGFLVVVLLQSVFVFIQCCWSCMPNIWEGKRMLLLHSNVGKCPPPPSPQEKEMRMIVGWRAWNEQSETTRFPNYLYAVVDNLEPLKEQQLESLVRCLGDLH